MVTSRAVRPKKQTLTSVVETGTRTKRVSTRDKLLLALEKQDKGLNLTDLAFEANVKSCGNLSQILRFLLRSKEVVKETCPHCNHTELYKINI
jgi:predicted nucleic-acid-binding Zn-ribbon protein